MSHFTFNGIGLEYTWWGTAPRGMRQVVLIHGALRSAWTWDWLGHALATRLQTRVVALSRFGHGKSDVPTPSAQPDHRFVVEATEVLPAFRKALELEDVVLVGEGEGAAIAIMHAALGNAGVSGLAALAPWVRFERSIAQWVSAAHPSPQAKHVDPDETLALNRATWLHPDLERWSVDSFLGSVRCRAVVVQSPGDSAITPAQSQRVATGIGRCEAVWLTGAPTADVSNAALVSDLIHELVAPPPLPKITQ